METNARLLLLTLVYSPDTVSTATLLSTLVDELTARGHSVRVVTTTPHYNEEADAIAQQPLRPKWDHVLFESARNGTTVYHARIPKKRTRIVARLFDYIVFHAVSTVVALAPAETYDVILAPSPPMTIGLQAFLVARLRRVPFIYNVQEIYPDVAVALGLVHNKALIGLLTRIELFIYRRARIITVISERFRQNLIGKGVSALKIRVIPNFVDVAAITPSPQVNELSCALGLDGKFVVLYAGNIGLTQNFEALLDAASETADLPEIVFLVVGGGGRYEWLQQEVARRGLVSVRLLPYLPQRDVNDLYAASSVCVVPLKKGFGRSTFPSKIYTIMSAGRAALVVADDGSELWDVMHRAGCGVALTPERAGELGAVIRQMCAQPERLAAWGAVGRDYVVRHHSSAATADAYSTLLTELVNGI